MQVQMKARDLKVGYIILGANNNWKITAVRPSTLTGVSYPVIDVVDSFDKIMSIETGYNEKLQDHVYNVEIPDPPAVVKPKTVKKAVVKKPVKKQSPKKREKATKRNK